MASAKFEVEITSVKCLVCEKQQLANDTRTFETFFALRSRLHAHKNANTFARNCCGRSFSFVPCLVSSDAPCALIVVFSAVEEGCSVLILFTRVILMLTCRKNAKFEPLYNHSRDWPARETARQCDHKFHRFDYMMTFICTPLQAL